MAWKYGKLLAGGKTLTDGDLAHGYFVAPTLVDGLGQDHFLFRNELFVPFACVATFATLDEALNRPASSVAWRARCRPSSTASRPASST